MEPYFFTRRLFNILKSGQASANLHLSPDPKTLFYEPAPIIMLSRRRGSGVNRQVGAGFDKDPTLKILPRLDVLTGTRREHQHATRRHTQTLR